MRGRGRTHRRRSMKPVAKSAGRKLCERAGGAAAVDKRRRHWQRQGWRGMGRPGAWKACAPPAYSLQERLHRLRPPSWQVQAG